MCLLVYLGLVNFSEDKFRDLFRVVLRFLESTKRMFYKTYNFLRCLSKAKAAFCGSCGRFSFIVCMLCFVLLYPHLFILRHSHHLPLNEVGGVSLTCLGISVCSDDLSQTLAGGLVISIVRHSGGGTDRVRVRTSGLSFTTTPCWEKTLMLETVFSIRPHWLRRCRLDVAESNLLPRASCWEKPIYQCSYGVVLRLLIPLLPI